MLDSVHTVAFMGSHKKYVVKNDGSFPSVTLYSGTNGDKPSRDTAISMYFCKGTYTVSNIDRENLTKAEQFKHYLANIKNNLLFFGIYRLANPNKHFCMCIKYQDILSQQVILREVVNFLNLPN
jgi:hypothetical protein